MVYRKIIQRGALVIALMGLAYMALGLGAAWLAACARAQGTAEQSAAWYERAAVLHPWRGDWYRLAAEMRLSAGNIAQAHLDFKRAGQLNPADYDRMARVYLNQGQREAAEALWREQTAMGKGSALAFGELVKSAEANGDRTEMLRLWSAWAAADRVAAEPRYEWGVYQAATDPEAALDQLLEAARLDPNYTVKVGKLRQAINAAGLEEAPAARLTLIGRGLAAADEWPLAKEAFTQATQSQADYAEAWAFLGEAQFQTGEDGWPALQKAQRLNPYSVTVKALAALAYIRDGKLDAAVAYFYEISAAETGEPAWQRMLGQALADAGYVEEGLAAFQKAVEIAPDQASSWKALAEFCLANKVALRTVGLPAARENLLRQPEDPAALTLMGKFFMETDDLVTAERFLQQALHIDTTYPPATLALGQTYLLQNQPEQAKEMFLKVISLAPESLEGETARRLLERYFGEKDE